MGPSDGEKDLAVVAIRGTKQLAMGMGIFLMELSWRLNAKDMLSTTYDVSVLNVTCSARRVADKMCHF